MVQAEPFPQNGPLHFQANNIPAACIVTDESQKLEILDVSSRGIVLSM